MHCLMHRRRKHGVTQTVIMMTYSKYTLVVTFVIRILEEDVPFQLSKKSVGTSINLSHTRRTLSVYPTVSLLSCCVCSHYAQYLQKHPHTILYYSQDVVYIVLHVHDLHMTLDSRVVSH